MGLASQGWQCPICGGVYSPYTPQCFNCTGRYSASSSTEIPFQKPEGWFPIEYVSKEKLKDKYPDKPGGMD